MLKDQSMVMRFESMRVSLSLLGLVGVILGGCATDLRWVADPSPLPACEPDRLLEWSDFTPKIPTDHRGAETAIRFHADHPNRQIMMVLDSQRSWVKPELIEPRNSRLWRASERLLAHERLHFVISCLLVRQANVSLKDHDDLNQVLALTKLVAQRLNSQYDSDTNHGLNFDEQLEWEHDVMEQFRDIRR